MSKKSAQLGPFYTELLELLLHNSQQQAECNGQDPKLEMLWKNLPRNEMLPLEDIIERYQSLFAEKGAAHLEKALSDAFPVKDFIELGMTRTYPKVYRGLPRVYLKDLPSQSRIQPPFSHLGHLKRQALSRSLFSLYAKVPAKGKATLFTWVMRDGQGDFFAGMEVYRMLKTRLPDVCMRFVALVPEELEFPLLEGATLIPYKEHCPVDCLPEAVLQMLKQSDLILQLPTYYPHTSELREALKNREGAQPKFEAVGEYGFLESPYFHPGSGHYSMGLHFLEKGILTRKPCAASWEDVQNERLKFYRNPANRFYLAYLTSPIGGAIYLHSLLKSLENDPLDIDICLPVLGWFFEFYEQQRKLGRDLFAWDLGVSSLEIYFQEQKHTVSLQPSGKKLRLICPGLLSQSDFRALLALSGDWVAVRGNQSFSEAVSQGKAFFYDGRAHAQSFIKDLAAIAENRIGGYPGTLQCIRGMAQGFLYNVSAQDDTWVDENYF
ncbi:MAG: hypothetical protein KGQ49_04570, partial [Verrucomicrobia bacterium]|nr:hypothetical protein [Verrucomicrobiota bacterium]